MNNYKILAACMLLTMYSINSIDAMENASYQELGSNSEVQLLYSEITNKYEELQQKISLVTDEKISYVLDSYAGIIIDNIQEFTKHPYGESANTGKRNLNSLISYINKYIAKKYSTNDEGKSNLENIKKILEQILDKFTQIVSITYESNDVPIDVKACKSLLDKVNNDMALNTEQLNTINKQLEKLNKQLKNSYEQPRPYTKQVVQEQEALQAEFNELQKESLNLSNQALKIQELKFKIDAFYKQVKLLKSNKANINENNIINCYQIFMELYKDLKNDIRFKQIWDQLTPFYNYVIKKYSDTIREQNLPY